MLCHNVRCSCYCFRTLYIVSVLIRYHRKTKLVEQVISVGREINWIFNCCVEEETEKLLMHSDRETEALMWVESQGSGVENPLGWEFPGFSTQAQFLSKGPFTWMSPSITLWNRGIWIILLHPITITLIWSNALQTTAEWGNWQFWPPLRVPQTGWVNHKNNKYIYLGNIFFSLLECVCNITAL